MVSTRSSIYMKYGNFFLCALLRTYLHWISPVNLFIHYSVVQNPSITFQSLPSSSLILLSLYHQLMLSPDSWWSAASFTSKLNMEGSMILWWKLSVPTLYFLYFNSLFLSIFLLMLWLLSSLWQGTFPDKFCLQSHLPRLLLILSEISEKVSQIGLLFTESILNLLKCILFLRISMSSLLSDNDLWRTICLLTHARLGLLELRCSSV